MRMLGATAKYGLGLLTGLMVALTFLYLRPVAAFAVPELAPMVALHLPNAMVTVIAAIAAGVYGWKYLARGRKPLDDWKSAVAITLATVFCLLTTITGAVFAKVQWGDYWNWDPKQICITILLLIYAAYFVLRAGVDDPEKRAVVSAVYILFATLMTPLLGYVIPKYMPSLHPKNAGFDSAYKLVIWGMSFALIGVYAWLHNIATRYGQAQLAWDALQADKEPNL